MIRHLLLFILTGLSCSDLFSQSRTVSGYVRDQATGESVIGASIYDSRQSKGTVTNNFGFYSLTTPYDSATLTISFVGYDVRQLIIPMNGDSVVVVLLHGKVLDEVVIRDEHIEKIHETSRTGTVNLPVAQIKAIPTFAGEQDVLKALQLVPGVSGGNEGSSNVLVRGGTPDQTLVLMDGVPIYNPTHLYGLYSSFNPDAVNNVDLVKSGFPARYGGRLSGIADITLREGNSNRFSAQATAGLLASRLLLEGPIVKGRTSFLVSGRASYLTLMSGLLAEKVGDASLDGYKFYDLNAKVNHRINSNNRLYASMYSGSDRMTTSYASNTSDTTSTNNIIQARQVTRDAIQWTNLLTSLRWNHEISSTQFFNVTAYTSGYNYTIENNFMRHEEQQPTGVTNDFSLRYKWTSKIRDVGMKIDFDYIPNTRHYLRYGGAFIHHAFSPAVGAKQSSDSVVNIQPVNTRSTTNELNVYIEDDFNVTSKLKVNAGLHGLVYSVPGKTYQGLQPRFSLRYSIANNISVKASYAYMQQYLQTLTNAGLGFPIDLWVPVTSKVKPAVSQQFAVGAAQTIRNEIEISIEGFYKRMNNLLEYQEGASYLDNQKPWYNMIEHGQGRSYGVEFFVQKKVGRLTGLFGYTLSWNKRQFDNLNNGQWYYSRFDHRHDFKTTINYRLNNKHYDVSATFIFATGSAVTAPVGRYLHGYPPNKPYTDGLIDEYQSRGNYRMQPYHRLDLNVNYTFTRGRFEHKASIGLYNAYDRLNPFYIQYDYNRDKYSSVALFPIMPAANYSIKF